MSALQVGLLVFVLGVGEYALGVWVGLRRRDVEHDLVWCRDQWTRDLSGPYVTEDGTMLLPCPYCGTRAGHLGSCRLGQMRSGKIITVYGSVSWDVTVEGAQSVLEVPQPEERSL